MNLTLSNARQRRVLFDGHAWRAGRCLDGVSAREVFDAGGFDDFTRAVGGCNGLFRVVVQRPGELFAAVDRVRSHPLFYGAAGREVFVSPDAYWLRGRTGDRAPEAQAAAQLWHMLYVLGDRTLAGNVRQLPAGHALHVRMGGPAPVLRQVCYYSYVQRPAAPATPGQWMERLDEILDRAFGRLLESTGGRLLVVPLSGGLDSRLVACMLRRLEAPHVLCFSYGSPGNAEAQASRQAAGRLGLPWEFVSYRDIPWQDSRHCRQRDRFCRFSANLSALPPLLEDYLAVEALRRRGRIGRQAVFCPGHTACFSSGRRALLAAARAGDVAALAREVLRQHCPRFHWSRPEPEVRQALGRAVMEGLERLRAQCPGPWDAPMLLEAWNWMERQSKRIINMARAYEFWGCSWRIPLWDHELMDFWAGVPFELRQSKRLYRQYLLSRSQDRFFGMYDHLGTRPGWSQSLSRWLGRAARRLSWIRYLASEDNFERLLCGSYGRYLRRVGRRGLSLEPVTSPWLLLEQDGLEKIWSADGDNPAMVTGAA